MNAAVSRRDFLARSGALVVSFSAAGSLVERVAASQGQFGTRESHVDPRQLDSWIAIAADGRVTAFTGKVELGQGIATAQAQLVAEELMVPFGRVTLVYGDTDVCPDQGTTSGSQSSPTNFNERSLAQACATAREALLKLASDRLGAPVDRLTIVDGVVTIASDRSKVVTYGELVAGKKLNIALSATARRRSESDWTVLGTSAKRGDIAAIATGQFEFVHNVRVPGMLHGRVVRPPEVGATVVSVDEGSVRAMPGVVKVVTKKSFVGVVAQKPWQAIQAANALKVSWSTGAGLPPLDTFHAQLRTMPARDGVVVDSGDVDRVLGGAKTVVKATYLHPYQMHASMGTSCAVADVRNGNVTVWSATQSPYPTRSGVAMVLGVPVDSVRVVFTRGSGCYGINGADTVSYDAAILSQAAGAPVRVQLTRKDEMAWENYGVAAVIDQQVGVSASGEIIAWDCEIWSPSRGGRPGYDRPGNVVTGMLAGFEPQTVSPGAAGAPRSFANNSNAAPSYVRGAVGGSRGGTGTVASERVRTHTVRSPFFTGPLRSPSRLQNTFAHECLMDEVAAALRVDPIMFRLKHISDPRLRDVVNACAAAARWDARPSPRGGTSRSSVERGRGFSCVLYEGDNGYVAMVAEVEVDKAAGRVSAKRFVVAQDCGPISNPDGMRNQLEGGALQGFSRAIGEEVTWDTRKVTSVDWRTFHSLTLGMDVPVIESVLMNKPGVEAMGAGETAITLVAAAIGNAIFDATGSRIRQVPFTTDRIKAALRDA
jgi:CO/xanthine dehydrogenase Mo-binding subunit